MLTQPDRGPLTNGLVKLAHDLDDEAAKGETKRTEDIAIDEELDFGNMLLSERVLTGLYDSGFKRPSPIQLKTIPTARCGVDLIVQAKSGTGKTCVFVVVALETVMLTNAQTQVLIMAPTREIACQIHHATLSIGRHLPGLKCGCFIGGQQVRDNKVVAKEAHIVIGTPGRICQLIQEGDISVDGIRLFVLDEADKLMEETYQENINWIFSKLPTNKQLLVLSATYPRHLDEFLSKYMRNPQKIQLDSTNIQLIGIKQYMAITKVATSENWFEKRVEHLHLLLSQISFKQCLIFCNYQDKVEPLCAKLKERNWAADFIGAHISQAQRLNVIKRLKSFRCRILISTDLTARGIDAKKVNLVINFDIPYNSETYLHRIGRAGRYGGYGAAITVLCGWQAEFNFYQMIAEQKLSIKMLPENFPTELVSDEQFYANLDAFVVPDLTDYARKSMVKAAKKSVRTIGHENYATISKGAPAPERIDAVIYAAKGQKHVPFPLNAEFDRSTLMYDRKSMFRILKRILNVQDEGERSSQEDRMPKYTTAKPVVAEKEISDLIEKTGSNSSADATVLVDSSKNDAVLSVVVKSDDACSTDSGHESATTPPSGNKEIVKAEPDELTKPTTAILQKKEEQQQQQLDVSSIKEAKDESDSKIVSSENPVESRPTNEQQAAVTYSRRHLNARYINAFTQTYDDYLNQIYGGFVWRKSVVDLVSSVTSSDAPKPKTTVKPNRTKYDRSQILTVYNVASCLDWPSSENQRQCVEVAKKSEIYADHLKDVKQKADRSSRVFHESNHQNYARQTLGNDEDVQEEYYDEVEKSNDMAERESLRECSSAESEVDDETSACWHEYGELLKCYQVTLKKVAKIANKHGTSSKKIPAAWSEYLTHVKKYENSFKH